ncbi:Pkinase-fungal domain-containing protein [Mycena venus]|uniref:Pkinase-fungal domain-containing protein n=1 Tax=Mycena venus TaxID=2733690 RepID=A0A8H6XA65_9AGAR|nr:Pkinase-fungal domain-containing protein [Mycena venus]
MNDVSIWSDLVKTKQFEALELYETAASGERDAMARSILPGREPPSASLSTASDPPPVVPSASFSQLLPTDSEAVKYPNKTLVSVVATGVIGSLTTGERREQRSEDARYCARHFAGHVVLSPLDVVLARLGTSALVDKLAELKEVACNQIDATLKDAVLANFSKESISSSKPVDRTIDNRYWLSRLADAALSPAADGLLLALDYYPTPAEKLPEEKQHGYKKRRKYDASLRPSAAHGSSIFNIFVNVEFTNTDPPNVAFNPLIGATDHVAKYQQAITNADDLLKFQSTRLFVPTLSFHGKGKNTKLFVSILSCDRFEFAVIDHCFDSNKFPTVSALLHLFRIASLYQLGYSPLFIYNFTSPPPGFSVGDAVPAHVVLGAVKVRLSGKRLSQLRSTPFQRSTVVLEGELDKQFPDRKGSTYVVVKMSFIAEGRLWREKIIVDALHTANVQPAPAYAPKILAAFAAHDSPPSGPPNDSEILRNGKRPAGALEDLPAMVPRHLELKDVSSAAEFLATAEDLFRAILDAFRRRVLHRDISVNNILVADNQLLIVDWEIGRRFQEPSSAAGRGTVTGTLDTMSMASLANRDPLPHDDIESAVYVLLKVLTQTFVPPADQEREWATTLDTYCWDDPDVQPKRLLNMRLSMWMGRNFMDSTVGQTVRIFRSSGHATRAQLIHSLLSLPLPDQRDLINSSDYDTILSSLQGLVEQAVAAVHSVDASSLIWGSAKVVDAGQEEI